MNTSITSEEGRTELANALRFVQQGKEDLRWCPEERTWYAWDGQRWRANSEDRALLCAEQVATRLWEEARQHSTQGMELSHIRQLFRFAQQTSQKRHLDHMLELAQGKLSYQRCQYDLNPWLFNVVNGTLNLKTGELQPHRREDLLTQLSPVEYDEQAECPTWRRFLVRIFNKDQRTISYLARLIGYSLTGVIAEHILIFLHGAGSNGKSTIIEVILHLLGEYGMKAPPELLLTRRQEAHATERADLVGKRFAACMETGIGRYFNEPLVKELTGGDSIRARKLYRDSFEFRPTHHLWLVSNHKPLVQGMDHGIWRRIKLIPFKVNIPEAQQDLRLMAKLCKELPGILNWVLHGCLEWQKKGLQEPTNIKQAIESYRSESDPIHEFVQEHCIVAPRKWIYCASLYDKYRKATSKILDRRLFDEHLLTLLPTLKKGRTKGKQYWSGISLQEDEVPQWEAFKGLKRG